MISTSQVSNQYHNEEIVLHLRRHWFIFFRIFIFFILLAGVPALLYFLLINNLPSIMESVIGQAAFLVLLLTCYLMLLVAAFTAWTKTYLDVWTITTYRIINREQNDLFYRVVSELDLSLVQDVTAEQKGFFPTVFHYGDVYIQSAGTKERFVFEQIANPYKIAKMIQKLNEQARKNSGQGV